TKFGFGGPPATSTHISHTRFRRRCDIYRDRGRIARAAYLAAPLARKESANWVGVGLVNSFGPGAPKLVSVAISRAYGWRRILETRTCWVSISQAGEIIVFNGRCTHLGCAYGWQTQGRN